MRTKEEYYQSVLKNRLIANDPENRKCSCPKTRCEWHGKCEECVTIHRFHKDHLPACFQQFVKDQVLSLTRIVELEIIEKEKRSDEYWDYVQEQDRKITG